MRIDARATVFSPLRLHLSGAITMTRVTHFVSPGFLLLSMALFGFPVSLRADIIAYHVNGDTVGSQEFGGQLGMDFIVNQTVFITQLGAFDSGQDGFNLPITVNVWKRLDGGTPDIPGDDSGDQILATTVFSGLEGTLVGGNRFKLLPDALELPPGAYTISGSGYGAGEPNGNVNGPASDAKSVNNGNGLLTFVGSARYGVGDATTFPDVPDGGPVNRYSSGTFQYTDDLDRVVGDVNGDRIVNIEDFGIIRDNFYTVGGEADLNFSGLVDIDDFRIWKDAFGGGGPNNVPEPHAGLLFVIGGLVGWGARRLRACR
jgi:hypothetical protein